MIRRIITWALGEFNFCSGVELDITRVSCEKRNSIFQATMYYFCSLNKHLTNKKKPTLLRFQKENALSFVHEEEWACQQSETRKIIVIFTCRDTFFPVCIMYNYPPKGRWIVVDIYRGIYPPLFTDPDGDSCFSIILPNQMDKKMLL